MRKPASNTGPAKQGRAVRVSAEPSVRQAANAAVQPSARLRQQSAKPKGGKAVPRLARASESPVSNEEASEASGSSDEEEDEEGSSEDGEEEDEEGSSKEGEEANSRGQQLTPGVRLSSQQGDDGDDYPDDSPEPRDRSSPEAEATPLQQLQPQAGDRGSKPAAEAFPRADSPQQLTHRAHTEHMHVAVRARPIPSGVSASCWVVDPNAATITMDGTATAAKRKQALYSSNATRSSTSSGLDSGQSRGVLGTAPGTPGIGFWDSGTPTGTSMGYKFDQVLDESSETAVVYSKCIQSLVHSALEGVNGTVLAYGGLSTNHETQSSACMHATML